MIKSIKSDFWKNKNVLITGHTGFKGSWLSIYLLELGANVIGYSLEPKNDKDNYNLTNLKDKIIDIKGDILDYDNLKIVFNKYQPDIVFHLAAQPLVIQSYKNPIETYKTNVIGTLNVLECINSIPKKVVGVMITTDKCYENKEQYWGYREDDNLGGYDIYSSSKACCEILINSYRNSFFNINEYELHQKDISSVRAGNVIGGGDWSEYRLIPDCIKAFEEEREVLIRNPNSIRPWQHVLEAISGYIILAQKMYENPTKYSGAYNFGPNVTETITVEDLARQIAKSMNKEHLVKVQENSLFHEASLLFLDISKSRFKLGWNPILNIDDTIDYTIDWYKNYKYKDCYNICKEQVSKYTNLKESAYGDKNE